MQHQADQQAGVVVCALHEHCSQLQGVHTWVELSRESLRHNLRLIAQVAGGSWGAVVKGNAYGHGFEQMVTLLCMIAAEEVEVVAPEWLIVSSGSEALQARALGWQRRILVLSHYDVPLEALIQQRISITVYDSDAVRCIAQAARRAHLRARVQVQVDTGMHHLGIPLSQLDRIIGQIRASDTLVCESVWTHSADSNGMDDQQLLKELHNFEIATQDLAQDGVLCHIRSSGTISLSGVGGLVRVGTLLYGSWKSALHQERVQRTVPHATVRPIATWKSRVLQVKWIEPGEYVGYGRTFCAARETCIAIVACGYYEGYMRSNSGKGVVVVRGIPCAVVGIVGMNTIAIEVTHVREVAIGDVVHLMGDHPSITPAAIAERLETNPNEVTTAMRPDLLRVCVS